MSLSKNSKLLQLLNCRLKVTITDGRVFIGQMLAFDKHLNFVLGECEEFRKLKPKKSSTSTASTTTDTNASSSLSSSQQHQEEVLVEREEKRSLGLVILRGELVVSMSIESGPPPSLDASKQGRAAAMPGPGMGRAAGRGMPIAPGAVPGLSGPVRGVGGPGVAAMQPQMGRGVSAPPMAYGRPPMPMPPGMPYPPRGPPMTGGPPGMPMPPHGFPPGMPPPPPGYKFAKGPEVLGFRPPPGMGMPMPPPGFPPGPPGYPPRPPPPQ